MMLNRIPSRPDGMDERPVLFLHIPKTAGTSFLLGLRNAFGDNSVRRIVGGAERLREELALIIETELEELSCLSGHLPLHLVENTLDHFLSFTVLREPVARVLSLYRFLQLASPAEHRRLQLSSNFTIRDFLNSRHPELHAQINDGMVRMLSGMGELSDPTRPEFWDIGADVLPVERALENLSGIGFGLAERMPDTLRLATQHFRIPYSLKEYHENTTSSGGDGDAAIIHSIVRQNTLDLALYLQAKHVFHQRVRQPEYMRTSWNKRSIFTAPLDRTVSIGNIPGRRGFHEFEAAGGLSWLHAAAGKSDIYFIISENRARANLRFYAISTDYPVYEILLFINERPVAYQVVHNEERWFRLITDEVALESELNVLAIQLPLFIPVRALSPGSNDPRHLGAALAEVAFESSSAQA